MNNIEELNKLIQQSADIAGIDNKQDFQSYLSDVLEIYPLKTDELSNLKICFVEGKSVSQAITRLSNIKLKYETVINKL